MVFSESRRARGLPSWGVAMCQGVHTFMREQSPSCSLKCLSAQKIWIHILDKTTIRHTLNSMSCKQPAL